MKYVVLTPNADGKFEYSKEELQKLLDDVYEQGKKDASPSLTYNPFAQHPKEYQLGDKSYQTDKNWTIELTGASK